MGSGFRAAKTPSAQSGRRSSPSHQLAAAHRAERRSAPFTTTLMKISPPPTSRGFGVGARLCRRPAAGLRELAAPDASHTVALRGGARLPTSRLARTLAPPRLCVQETDFDSSNGFGHRCRVSSEIIFEVTEAEEGGYCATALGHGITTQAETVEELRTMVRDAVSCFFDDPEKAPKMIRLHFVRDEVLAR